MKTYRCLLALLLYSACAPSWGDNAAPRIVGLLELPSVFGTRDPDGPPGLTPPARPSTIPLHSQPGSKAPIVIEVSDPGSIEAQEFDYEALAAVAYAVSDEWVLIRVKQGSKYTEGWIPPRHRGPFHPILNLLKEGLTYSTKDWDGVLLESPGASGAGRRVRPDPLEMDINILETKAVQGTVWLKVELLGPGRCNGTPKVIAQGWLSLYAKSGKPNAWFRSRGC
jgi:hypothetical protein